MTARLPVVGGDNNQWGTVLNQFLQVSHNSDGTIISAAVSQAGGEMTANKGQVSGYAGLNTSGVVPTAQLGSGTASSSNFLRGDGTWAAPPDATTSSKGIVELTGDLGGTAASPSVLKVNGISINGTPSQGQLLTATSSTAAAWTTAPWFNVKNYGAVGDGTTNDTTALQNAITAAAASGGTVILPTGTYLVSSTITLGNGTVNANSTQNNIHIVGEGVDASTIKWGGTSGGTVCAIAGISSGNSFSGLTIDGAGTAGIGLDMVSAQNAIFPSLRIKGTTVACLKMEVLTGGSNTITWNTLGNHFSELYLIPSAGTNTQQSHGLWMTGASWTYNTFTAAADSNNNTFDNLLVLAEANYCTAIRLGFCDFNNFLMVNCFTAGTGTYGLHIDGSVYSSFPANNMFQQANFNTNPLVSGSPGVNTIWHLDLADGGLTVPTTSSGLVGLADNPGGGVVPLVPFGMGRLLNVQSSTANQLITSTSATNLCTLSSPPDGMYVAYVYIRVTGSSNVTVSCLGFTGDDTGTQWYYTEAIAAKNGTSAPTILNNASLAPGSYSCLPLILRYASGAVQKPVIQMTVGTANVVYVSISIVAAG